MPHGTAATYAVENAMGYGMATGTNNGYSCGPTEVSRLVRNLTQGGEFIMSHITHFYTLAALDLVKGPPMAPWDPAWDSSYYDPLLSGGTLTWTSAGVPTDIYTAVITDYVIALKARVKAIDMGAIFGGRLPIQSSYVAGGTTHIPTADDVTKARSLLYGGGGYSVSNPAPLSVADFVKNHLVPMTEIVSVLYSRADNTGNNWPATLSGSQALSGLATGRSDYFGAGLGIGAGCGNFYSAGVFDGDTSGTNSQRLLKRGAVSGGTSAASGTWEDIIPADIIEYVKYSRYDDSCSGAPASGSTIPNATKAGAYTWHKAPRYPNTNIPGSVKEVGPLARMWVNGNYYGGKTNGMRNHAWSSANGGPLPALSGVPYNCGLSLMDRHRARALEAEVIVTQYATWLTELETAMAGNDTRYIAKSLPTARTEGLGMTEAPRGSVHHWVRIKDQKVENYQLIAPTTWNGSGRDANGRLGPIEQALVGAPIRTVKSGGNDIPVEALMVVHSFDPCIACSVHVIDAKNNISKCVWEEGGVSR